MQKEHNLLYIVKHITEPKEFQQHKKRRSMFPQIGILYYRLNKSEIIPAPELLP